MTPNDNGPAVSPFDDLKAQRDIERDELIAALESATRLLAIFSCGGVFAMVLLHLYWSVL